MANWEVKFTKSEYGNKEHIQAWCYKDEKPLYFFSIHPAHFTENMIKIIDPESENISRLEEALCKKIIYFGFDIFRYKTFKFKFRFTIRNK